MNHYEKSHIKEIYDVIKKRGVTEECFALVKELPIDFIIKDIIVGQHDEEIILWMTYILHEIYNQRGDVFITDSEYDELYAINKEYSGVDFAGSGVKTLKRFNHRYPMLRGTVEKIHYVLEEERPIINNKVDPRKSYEYWVRNVEKKIGYSLDNCSIRVSLKVDGVSGIIELDDDGKCERALKRGDVDNNEADEILLLRNKPFPGMKQYGTCGLKVEIYMNQFNYELYKEKYGHYDTPRSAVTSIVNSDEVDDNKLQYITIYDLEINADGETIMPDNIYFELPSATNLSALEATINELQTTARDKGIPADGVVIRLLDKKAQDILGRDGAINKFEVAYKFRPKKYKAILKDVNFSMGKGGSYTPRAEIIPININGTTITNISLGSIPRLITLDLRLGQSVYVTHDVIPYMYDCPDDKEKFTEKVIIPLECRYCGSELEYYNSRLACHNDDCYMIEQGRIVNYIQKVDIDDISDATVDRLMDGLGIDKIYQIYQLKDHFHKIIEMKDFGPVSTQKLLDAIEDKRKLPFDLIVGSLSIPNVGRTTMKTILNTFNTKEFLSMCETKSFNKLIKIKGIGDSVVRSLAEWSVSEQYKDFLELMKEVTELEPVKTLDSHTILFTKVRDYEFQKFLEDKGYGIADNYKRNVDVVIYNGDESKKTEKARADGKPVITLEEAHDIYGYTN